MATTLLEPPTTSPDTGFCDATDGADVLPLRCDLTPGHGGDRHEERDVATWLRDGSDVRYCTGRGHRTGRPVYRAGAAS